MGVSIEWYRVSDTQFVKAKRGDEMGDGNTVTSPSALIVSNLDQAAIVEGRSGTLHRMLVKVAQEFVPDLHQSLTAKMEFMADGGHLSNDEHIAALEDALSLALGLLGREDLQ